MNVGVIWWRSTSNDRLNQKPNSTTDKMSLGLIACQPSVSRVSAECQPTDSNWTRSVCHLKRWSRSGWLTLDGLSGGTDYAQLFEYFSVL